MYNWLSKMCKKEVFLNKLMVLNVEGDSLFSFMHKRCTFEAWRSFRHFLVIFFTRSHNIENFSWLLKKEINF